MKNKKFSKYINEFKETKLLKIILKNITLQRILNYIKLIIEEIPLIFYTFFWSTKQFSRGFFDRISILAAFFTFFVPTVISKIFSIQIYEISIWFILICSIIFFIYLMKINKNNIKYTKFAIYITIFPFIFIFLISLFIFYANELNLEGSAGLDAYFLIILSVFTVKYGEDVKEDYQNLIKKLRKRDAGIILGRNRREKITPNNFFALSPLWEHYEKGAYLKRNELNKIFLWLNNKKKCVSIIFGNAASAKTWSLGYISYKLLNKNHCVFLIDWKKDEINESEIFEELNKFDFPHVVVIIDNIHIFSRANQAEELFKNFEQRCRYAKIILGSRPSFEMQLKLKEPKAVSRIVKIEEKIELKTTDNLRRELINLYCHHFNKRKLRNDEIDFLSKSCREDLLLLGEYLGSWEGEEIGSQLYDRVLDNYYNNLESLKSNISAEIVEIIFCVSAFSQYELYVEDAFLNNKFEEKNILKLTKAGELELLSYKTSHDRVERNFFIPHSSRAKIYVDVNLKNYKKNKNDIIVYIKDYIEN